MQTTRGFTLIELMLVVAIIGILSGIAIPQFASLVRKSQESTTKANLGVIRSALAIYYGDNEGWYPTDDLASLVPKYLTQIPMKNTPPFHPVGNTVSEGDAATQVTSTGDWFYFGTPYASDWGHVVVNCVHQDVSGSVWSSY